MRSALSYSAHFDVHGGVALFGILVLVLSSGFAFGGAELMQADSARPSGGGSEDETLLTRDHLLGDWGGVRSALNAKGISTEFTFTTFHAGVFQGDAEDKDSDWGHRVDAFIGADTEKVGLWAGGVFQVHLESRHGAAAEREVSRTGGLWPANSAVTLPLGNPDRLVATSLYYRHRLGQRASVMLGKINVTDLLANDPFFGGWGRDRFSNLVFTAPPSGVTPPVIMGVIANYQTAPFTWTFMVFDPNDQTNDNWPSDLFEEGVNVSLTATWAGKVLDRASSLGLTVTYSSQEGVDLRDLVLPPGLEAGTKEGSYNIALNASHLFWESSLHRGRGLGFYARAAIADGNPNPIKSTITGGFAGYGVVPNRPQDVFGIGVYHHEFSNDLRLSAAPLVELGDETGAEVFYNFEVTPWLHVTADLQWVRPVRSSFRDTWAGGIRASVNF